MKTINKLTTFLFAVVLVAVSCSNNEIQSPQEESNNSQGTNEENVVAESDYVKSMRQKLIGTTWILTQSKKGSTVHPHHATIYFKSSDRIEYSNVYSDYDEPCPHIINGESKWWFNKDEKLCMSSSLLVDNTSYYNSDGPLSDATISGELLAICAGQFDIEYITDTEMKLSDDTFGTKVFKKGTSNSTSGGYGESFDFTDFTADSYTTSVIVYFYTSQAANSATVYYGKSSPTTSVSTSIANKRIQAKISGLTRGTKYYVKCVAKNANGTITSETFPITTLY